MEKIFYELKPFLCVLGSAYVLKVLNLGGVGHHAAVILLVCGLAIIFERARNRGYF